MNDYEVTVTLGCTYHISAPTEMVAKQMALEYFDECEPVVELQKLETVTEKIQKNS